MEAAKNLRQIVWLASYPKSGNTWFRAFITGLLGDGEVEINNMKTDGIFSSRELFKYIANIDSEDLYEDEVKLMLPDVFRQLAAERDRPAFVKVHDAFTHNLDNQPIIPEDVTRCAVYLIRNPLDVAGSLANHNGSTIEEAVTLLNNPNGYLAKQKHNLNLNNQTPQLMLDWSSHVKSWTTLPHFPVYVLRYEDMLTDTFASFKNVLQAMNTHFEDDQISKAIDVSSFEALSKQEKNSGFKEKNIRSSVFFRGGKMGNWKHELTDEQAERIISCHYEVMKQYNYLP